MTDQITISWIMLAVMYAAFVAGLFIRDNAPALEAEKALQGRDTK